MHNLCGEEDGADVGEIFIGRVPCRPFAVVGRRHQAVVVIFNIIMAEGK